MKFESWVAMTIFIGTFLAGVFISPAAAVGLPVAQLGAAGFLIAFIFDRIYTDKSEKDRQALEAAQNLGSHACVRLDAVEKEHVKLITDLTTRIHHLEEKSKSLQSTVSFMKGK